MKYTLYCMLAALLFAACNGTTPTEKETKSNESAKKEVYHPDFDKDSAYYYVKQQTDFGPRTPGSDAHKNCAAYLEEKLAQYCDTAMIQKFVATTCDDLKFPSYNVIGMFSPEKTERILLGAHWDSRPFADADPNPENWDKAIDGANDGASGVGVLVEVARQLSIKNPNVGVDIVFFDMEDYGVPAGQNIEGDWWGLGSQYWAKNPHKSPSSYKYGILLDMVGDSQAKFLREGFSDYYASTVVTKVWKKAYELGYGANFLNQSGNPITDDHYYVNTIANIPMIDIIHQDHTTNSGFASTWHTMEDNLQNIDPYMLDIVGRTVLAVLYEE